MKVFFYKGGGVWLGSLTIAIATSKEEAIALIQDALNKEPGLSKQQVKKREVKELDTTKANAVVLDNGDY